MYRAHYVTPMVCGLFALFTALRADVPQTAAEQRALAQAASRTFSYQDLLWAPSSFSVISDGSSPRRTFTFSTMPCVEGLPERPVRVIASAMLQDAYIKAPSPKHMNIVTLVFTYCGSYAAGDDRHVLLLLSKSGKTIGYFGFTSVVHARKPHP